MRIFGNLFNIFKLNKYLLYNSARGRHATRCPILFNPRPNKSVPSLIEPTVTRTNSGSANNIINGTSVTVNTTAKNIAAKPLPINSSSLATDNLNILPVALINSNKTKHTEGVKILVIPINLINNDEKSVKATLEQFQTIKNHANLIDSFSKTFSDIKEERCTESIAPPLKVEEVVAKIPEQFPSTMEATIEIPKWLNLDDNTESLGHDDALAFYESLDSAMHNDTEIKLLGNENSFDVLKWDQSKRKLLAFVPESLQEKLQKMAISSMQLAFEMNMTNINDAILMDKNPKDPREFTYPKKASLQDPMLAISTSVEVDPPSDNYTVPLNFNALIQGTINIDTSKMKDSLLSLTVPEFNDDMTAIAANICSTALQKGFPTDTNRMYSTQSTTSTNKTPSTIEFVPTAFDCNGNSYLLKRDSSMHAESEPSNNVLNGLLSCNAYAKALAEATKRREALKNAKKAKKMSCAPCSPKTARVSKKPKAKEIEKQAKNDKPNEPPKKRRGGGSCNRGRIDNESVGARCPNAPKDDGRCKKEKKAPGASTCDDKDKQASAQKAEIRMVHNGCDKEGNTEKPCDTNRRKGKHNPCAPPKPKKKREERKKDPCKKKEKKEEDPCKTDDPCKMAKSDTASTQATLSINNKPRETYNAKYFDRDGVKTIKCEPESVEPEKDCVPKKEEICRPEAAKAVSPCDNKKPSGPKYRSRSTSKSKSKCKTKSRSSSKSKKCAPKKAESKTKAKNQSESELCSKNKMDTKPKCDEKDLKSTASSKSDPCTPKSAQKSKSKSKSQPKPKAKAKKANANGKPKSKSASNPNCAASKGPTAPKCRSNSSPSKNNGKRCNSTLSWHRSRSLTTYPKNSSLWKSEGAKMTISNVDNYTTKLLNRFDEFLPKQRNLNTSAKLLFRRAFSTTAGLINGIYRFYSKKGKDSEHDEISATFCKEKALKFPKLRRNITYPRHKTCFDDEDCNRPCKAPNESNCGAWVQSRQQRSRDKHYNEPFIKCNAHKLKSGGGSYCQQTALRHPKRNEEKSSENENENEGEDGNEMNRNEEDDDTKENKNFINFYNHQQIHKPSYNNIFVKQLQQQQRRLFSSANRLKRNLDDELTNEIIKITECCTVKRVTETIPIFSDYDVLVRTETVALSGSDVHVYETGGKVCPVMTLGHDAAAVIEKVGKCVMHLSPGDRVALEAPLSCGICDYCKQGLYNMCTQLYYNGFLSKYQAHPADLCHKLPDSISTDEGSMVQTLALGCQACLHASITPTTNVLVIGSCPTAVSAALCARAFGAKNVCLCDRMEDTIRFINKSFNLSTISFNGVEDLNDTLECIAYELTDWPQVVINCSISELTMNLAVMALQPCGTCILCSCEHECACFNAIDVIMKNIKLIPSFRSINMFPTAIHLIRAGFAPMGKFISKAYCWDGVEKAFRAAQHEANVGNRKVIVRCAEELTSSRDK